MKQVKFTGKFTDLIPDGWTFQKLFARNYRQYHKTCDGEKYSQGCRIWQHHGGYLEIDELGDLSWVVVKQIQDGKLNEWAYQSKSIFAPKENKTVYWFLVDMDNGVFLPYNSPEHIRVKRSTYLSDGQLNTTSYDAYAKRYREWNMNNDLIPMIQDLISKNWIKVVDLL